MHLIAIVAVLAIKLISYLRGAKMADWNSSQYLKFKNQRTQPAVDLAMRMINRKPKKIADIGCGPGNSTSVLKSVFPESYIIGIDNSPNMIEKARNLHPDMEFGLCGALELEGTYDMLFSNACLQWIPDHETLIPALMNKLNDGGVLAVQIPMNGEEPLFQLIKETAAEPKWGLEKVKLQPNETLTPLAYFDILADCSTSFEIWETKYYHCLEDHKALVEWVKGTRLRPYLDFLGETRGNEFEHEIVEGAKKIYPIRKNGGVILGFRRFFFTAEK